MAYLLPLLAPLACPVGMGLMMWFILRLGKEQTPSEPRTTSARRMRTQETPLQEGAHPSSSSPLKAILDCVQMCLNWKVLVGLAVIVLLIGVVAPHLFWVALPALVALVCPLSMGVMMVQMGRTRRAQPTAAHPMELGCPACHQEPLSEQRPHEEVTDEQVMTPHTHMKW